jgi:glycosyltransferase involved in cell wall biosynthesis
MRILWVSNAPFCRTGYGTQTRLFVPRIQALGHTVHIMANYGLAGGSLQFDSKTVILPLANEVYGNDILAQHAQHMGADIVLTLYDAWVFASETMRQVRWVPWMPVDSDPLPERVLQALTPAWQPIAYSKFGERKLTEAGLHPLYVPHGVETSVYCPGDKAEARERLGLPQDVFVAAMVAANKGYPSRKAYPECLWAWREFVKVHPDAVLYLHTHMNANNQGIDLPLLIRKLGIPTDNVRYCDQYYNTLGFDDDYMVAAYRAADVLLSPSMGEGFGLPILEAQSCGCPVIVGDWTSMPELCFAGWKVQGQPFWIPGTGAWQFMPHIPSIVDALEQAYKGRLFLGTAQRARQGALEYDADLVAERYWRPVLERIERSLSNTGHVVQEVA